MKKLIFTVTTVSIFALSIQLGSSLSKMGAMPTPAAPAPASPPPAAQ
jgi:hypothetical protein